ncbi:MAG TPA: hypothetical protein VJB39_01115 [Patescibacteria group bacterium]|nr:hypothetical protein [Patescibacteria group bacterium]
MKYIMIVVLVLSMFSLTFAEPMESADSSPSVGRKVTDGPLVVLTASEIEKAGGIYFSSVTEAGEWFQLKVTVDSDVQVLFMDKRGNVATVREQKTLSVQSSFSEKMISAERRGNKLFIYTKSIFPTDLRMSSELCENFAGR